MESIDPDHVWSLLKPGVENIFRGHNKVTRQQSMDMHNLVHHYCTRVEMPARSFREALERRRGMDVSKLASSKADLYKRLKSVFEDYVADLSKNGYHLTDEKLLEFYHTNWTKYQTSVRIIKIVFGYLHDYWIRRQIEEKCDGVYEIGALSVITWYKHFEPFNAQIINTIFKLIERHRNGETIDTQIISKILAIYIELDKHFPKRKLYRNIFESKFIMDVKQYFLNNCTECPQPSTVQAYLECVERLLNAEIERVQCFVHKDTIAVLPLVCEKFLIVQHLDILRTEFRNLLELDQNDVLGRMYSMVSPFRKTVEELANVFEEFAHKKGLDVILQSGDAAKNDANVFVKAVLEVQVKYSTLVSDSFQNDVVFVSALDKACNQFINKNEVTTSSNDGRIISEFLVKYCDQLLRNSDEANLESGINDTINIFKYIDDKDVFQKIYSKWLAKRLINQTSDSDDAEALMITKLKQICGNEYTIQFNRMLHDIAISKDLNLKFRQESKVTKTSNKIDFSVHVLSNGVWPFSKNISFSLPAEFGRSVQRFNRFYADLHSGRKLIWLYGICKGEMVANCFGNQQILQASVLQMAVLLQFNEQISFTVQQLSENAGMPQEKLIPVLQTLLKVKLLTSSDEENALTGESVIDLSSTYEIKRHRININIPLKTEQKTDQATTQAQIEQTRKVLIQAAIVRIMKEQKVLKHQNLVTLVLTELAHLFKPNILVIKRCIDILIEKEYLERKKGEADTYAYRA